MTSTGRANSGRMGQYEGVNRVVLEEGADLGVIASDDAVPNFYSNSEAHQNWWVSYETEKRGVFGNFRKRLAYEAIKLRLEFEIHVLHDLLPEVALWWLACPCTVLIVI